MRIVVNGETCELSATTLGQAIEELGFGGARIATAVDGDFVPVSGRARQRLSEGSRTEILAPMQGG